ncbi:MAG: MarR family transcriptional regulator [Pseudomonadota bacterium]
MNTEQRFVENFGLLMEEQGYTRMAGRILARLLICDPPHRSMTELSEELHASKSAISTASRQLIQAGLLERFSLPGERRDCFRVSPTAWESVMEEAPKRFRRFRDIAEQGLNLLSDASAERRNALVEMQSTYAFLEWGLERAVQGRLTGKDPG